MEPYDVEKFKNAVLFFATRVGNLGITKLNKLLYFSDFEHFKRYGRPILGDRYVRMEQGPVPSISYATFNANFRDKQDDSLRDAFDVRAESVFNYSRKTIFGKREPDLDVFSSSELEVMRIVAERWCSATARAVSDQSHLEKPWQNTPELGEIDYKLALDDNSVSRDYVDYREAADRLLEGVLSK